MTKKSVGYVKLEWTCPNCGTRNPGPQKTCTGCGYPQPDDVEFEQAASEELIKDQAEIEKAEKGPDIHCFYCGARNPADAKTCSQCGGDLTQGSKRKAGKVLGAHKKGPAGTITCKSCGAEVPANAPKCPNCGASLAEPKAKPKPATAQSAPAKPLNKFVIFGILALVLASMACCGFFLFSTKDLSGTVAGVAWERSVAIEAFGPVKHEDWQENIPAGANTGVCTPKVHHTQDSPPADRSSAKEICGTPYTVDKGSGYGEVVQDCRYEVYKDWCSYTVDEWQVVDRVKLQGQDLNPQWPGNLSLNNNRREGTRSEEYEIIFDADGERYTYTTGNFNLFQQAKPGSRWILTVNKLGGVTGIEPK